MGEDVLRVDRLYCLFHSDWFFHKSLDVLMLGDETAATLGLELRRTKTCIIILATVLTGTIVSISGSLAL